MTHTYIGHLLLIGSYCFIWSQYHVLHTSASSAYYDFFIVFIFKLYLIWIFIHVLVFITNFWQKINYNVLDLACTIMIHPILFHVFHIYCLYSYVYYNCIVNNGNIRVPKKLLFLLMWWTDICIPDFLWSTISYTTI